MLIKNPMAFSTEMGKLILKFIFNHKAPQTVKTILKKKNQIGGFILLLQFKTSYKATVIKIMYKHKEQ